MKSPLPVVDGVGASSHWLPAGPWPTLLAYLQQAFPEVNGAVWASRMARGLVVDADGGVMTVDEPYRCGRRIFYYREVAAEPTIPFVEKVLYQDEHLLIVDKPHFVPVVPAGQFLQQTLLVRLRRQLALQDLAPLHRLDRETAGLVMFSTNPDSRGRYARLFAERRVIKGYEALAAVDDALASGRLYRSRLVRGQPFFRVAEGEGVANSETHVRLMARHAALGRYRLRPLTGHKHQLRVHMAALGVPIVNDPLYPQWRPKEPGDFSAPLQLLARTLAFRDPLTGAWRRFHSAQRLKWPATA